MQSTEIFTLPFESESAIEQQYARLKRSEARKPFVVFFILWTVVFFLMWILSGLPRDITDLVGHALISAVLSLFVTFALQADARVAKTSTRYAWLPLEDCASLGTLCEKNPCLQSYRDQIREAGRRFTQGEADAMREWVSDQEARLSREATEASNQAACRMLYGIDSPDDVVAG